MVIQSNPQWVPGADGKPHGHPPYFQFAHLKAIPGVFHGVFTRLCGFSTAPFDSLNTSLGVGDIAAAVHANRERIRQCLGAAKLIFPSQVHGRRVAQIACNDDTVDPGGSPPEADALVTNQPGHFLAIQVADCQAILVVDPVARVVANIHAGWRGTVGNIVRSTIRTMVNDFHCRPGNLRVGISPSLGPCCAEFVNYRREIPARWWPYKDARHHFDFWAITRAQLIDEGVLEAHIATCELCTRCHPELFFSYRHTKITGRFTAVVGLG